MPEIDPAALVQEAGRGDRDAWQALVQAYGGLVWSVARGYRLAPADAADVSQTTWLRLVENLDRLQEPAKVASWLATTARRESLRLLRRGNHEVPHETGTGEDQPSSDDDPEVVLLSTEERTELWAAFRELTERCKLLLRVLSVTPLPSYTDVASSLGMPVGSIGPTRSRCLTQLRRNLTARQAFAEGIDR